MSVSLSESTVARLRALPDAEFRPLVETYMRVGPDALSEETLRAFRGPLLDRLIEDLRAMIRSVDVQMEAKAAEQEALAGEVRLGRVAPAEADALAVDYNRWRASAVRFRGRIEEFLAQHERLLRQTRVQELEAAITSHRSARFNSGSAADLRLWAVLGDDV